MDITPSRCQFLVSFPKSLNYNLSCSSIPFTYIPITSASSVHLLTYTLPKTTTIPEFPQQSSTNVGLPYDCLNSVLPFLHFSHPSNTWLVGCPDSQIARTTGELCRVMGTCPHLPPSILNYLTSSLFTWPAPSTCPYTATLTWPTAFPTTSTAYLSPINPLPNLPHVFLPPWTACLCSYGRLHTPTFPHLPPSLSPLLLVINLQLSYPETKKKLKWGKLNQKNGWKFYNNSFVITDAKRCGNYRWRKGE